MIIEHVEHKVIVECPDCHVRRTLNCNRYLFLSDATHRCRKCHANLIASAGGVATREKYKDTNHYQELGQKLRVWNIEHDNEGCKLGAKALSFEVRSAAGKKGGKSNVISGKLKSCAVPASNSEESRKKRHDTLKRRGLLISSRPEKRLHELLIERFGNDDVEHHVCVDGFRIDFYVKSINTYIELDGVYWHGLNVPYEQLKGTPKKKFDRDRVCDLHFKNKNIRLVRITDVELKENEGIVNDRV